MNLNSGLKKLLLSFFALVCTYAAGAQIYLNKRISLSVSKQPIAAVLKKMEQQGGFNFSYPGNLFKADSLVNFSVHDKTMRQALDILFNGQVEYEETEKHIILKRSTAQIWYASGYVYDNLTGERLSNVSVYEKRQLVSTMTNVEGYYRLKLKDKSQAAQISISKAWYIDTTIVVKPAQEQELSISIIPKELLMDTLEVSPQVEGSWLGKLFLSSRQKIQSLNMGDFFVDIPFQASLVPGLSTQGKMSTQMVNSFSFNLLGGYTAGTNGAELAGFFNISKQDAKYTQIAGLFNIVGGNMYGTQVGGLYNHVIDTVEGVQIAGLGNTVRGAVDGAQVGGFYNYSGKHMKGIQIGGFANLATKEVRGTQIAGFGNLAPDNMDGTQISAGINIADELNGAQIGGLFNYAKQLDGFQVGLINYADTSAGFSLGLINIVNKGYHKLSVSANEVMNLNLAFKTGNRHYYSIVFAGMNAGAGTVYSYGYGIGSEVILGKHLSFSPEISAHYLYLGSFKHANILSRGSLNLVVKLGDVFSIFGGPTYSVYYSDQTNISYPDFKTDIPGYKTHSFNSFTNGWIGWNAGVNIF